MRKQGTLLKAVRCSGVGLHTGTQVSLRILPAPVNTGIVFVRKGAEKTSRVKVGAEKVVGTDLCTAIGDNGFRIQTVEHLLSSLSSLRIDNALIKLDSHELPIMDGSAEPFVSLILKAGIKEQDKPQPTLRITRPIEVRDGEKYIILRPPYEGPFASDQLTVSCTIRFKHPIPIYQKLTYIDSPEAFVRELARARTFGFLHQVQALWAKGLARGGSLKNAILISESGVVNREGLRYHDELVRHKILDLLGDLSLLGRPIAGHVEAYCPGHQLNTKLVTEILKSQDSWVLEVPASEKHAPSPVETAKLAPQQLSHVPT